MSTKSHFLYADNIEGFEETSEPQSIFGKFTGYNVHIIIDFPVLSSVKIKDDFLFIELKNSGPLPPKMKIWGDAVVEMEVDETGLMLILKGGHYISKKFVSRDYLYFEEKGG
jgi:hypothetical protein